VTTAQLTHSDRWLAQPPRVAPVGTRACAAAASLAESRARRSPTLWRAIITGIGFALLGVLMMAAAIGTAGSVPLATGVVASDAPIVAPARADHRAAPFQRPVDALTPGGALTPIDALTSVMPVP
jgi:hypothetical protein